MHDIRFRCYGTMFHVMEPQFVKTVLAEDGTEFNFLAFRFIDGHKTHIVSLASALAGANYIVMRFSGMKDMDGKDIFEDDMIRWRDGKLHRVVFHKGCFCFQWGMNEWHIFDGADCTVMGNAHENPDLLSGS